MKRNLFYVCYIKPALDFAAALILSFLLAPILLLITLFISLHGIKPVFCHKRPGKNGHIFTLYKFQTMYPETKAIYPLGQLLRKTSLDELPQLFNILIGDMSIVGPRPLLLEYMEKELMIGHERFSMKPGVTGLAQVNGRNSLILEEKIALDQLYVNRVSFWFDVKILVKTLVQLTRFSQADYHDQKNAFHSHG